jgi:hypothetical protein
MRTIRASEIGTYLYCQRAWWYQKSGQSSSNTVEMVAGNDLHHKHGRAALRIGCLRLLAYFLLLLGLVILVVHFTSSII